MAKELVKSLGYIIERQEKNRWVETYWTNCAQGERFTDKAKPVSKYEAEKFLKEAEEAWPDEKYRITKVTAWPF